MNRLFILTIVIFLMSSYGCKKEKNTENWVIDEKVITYELEYNSTMQLVKYSILYNNSLNSYCTYTYTDTTVVETCFWNNSDRIRQETFLLDTNNRAVKSYVGEDIFYDTIIYAQNGFLSKIESFDGTPYFYSNNGTDITSESGNFFGIGYTPSKTLSKVSLPNNYSIGLVPLFTKAFGEETHYLIESYSSYVSGPGGINKDCRLEYKLDNEGYVTDVTKYLTSQSRYENELHRSISYVKYKYVFN